MRLADLKQGDHRMPAGFEVLAEISIDPALWYQFERLVADTPVTRIMGNTLRDDRMIVSVACASTSVGDRIKDAWE